MATNNTNQTNNQNRRLNEVTKSAIQAMRQSNLTKEQFRKTVGGEVYHKIQWDLVPDK